MSGIIGKIGSKTGTVDELDLSTDYLLVKPHIIPDVLYPAVSNIMVDGSTALSAVTTGPNGSTVTSSKYGTVQSDGRMYYYTDIKGSKPIKDPRIGAHFGSQRHKFKSLQKLEQESAIHGVTVHSIDGRKWCRAVSNVGNDIAVVNGSSGSYVRLDSSGTGTKFIEITGYFNDANVLLVVASDQDNFGLKLNGASLTANNPGVTQPSPNVTRYVDAASLINISFSSTPTLGINTIAIEKSDWLGIYGIELIAQDTTSAATRLQIQIPSQNVVSFGKKFTVADTRHYNPFAFKTDGTTAWTANNHNSTSWPVGTGSSTNIDTATSLGLAAWVSTNYYYPYNGGRVVKWVANDGTIKTSVNMMPPNARNIKSEAASEKGDDSGGTTSAAATNSLYTPTFTDIAIDHSQAEVAKTFHWREFGNGGANRNALYADASILGDTGTFTTPDDIAFVMDDGLTSLAIDDAEYQATHEVAMLTSADDSMYITFIGTGVSTYSNYWGTGWNHIVQNLPYGSHIFKVTRDADSDPDMVIDGIALNDVDIDTHGNMQEVSFHQPKMPPIPEDAVVIADYMLMADFVAQPASGAADWQFGKGVRACSSSRDSIWGSSTTIDNGPLVSGASGYTFGFQPSYNAETHNMTYDGWFADNVTVAVYNQGVSNTLDLDSSTDVTKIAVDAASHKGDKYHYNGSALSLEVHKVKLNVPSGGYPGGSHVEVPTPIHTSSHYQTFETPYLHELVGGDRNMEQTNLVVTPDGKTWDEVTRDVSYIGNEVLSTRYLDGDLTGEVDWDEWRGVTSQVNMFNKDIAISYTRLIFLKDGYYHISMNGSADSNGTDLDVKFQLNGNTSNIYQVSAEGVTSLRATVNIEHSLLIKRGDFIKFNVTDLEGYDPYMNGLQIRRLS